MKDVYAGTAEQLYRQQGQNAKPMRDRDPNCIDNVLKEIEVNLSEAVNSSENLADKLRGEEKSPETPGAPTGSDVSARLQLILNMVRTANQHLGRAHSAISG